MLTRSRVLTLTLTSLAFSVLAQSQTNWQPYVGSNYSFSYPAYWKLEVNGAETTATDPQDKQRWLGVTFIKGAGNTASWAQQCQSLDDLLETIAGKQQEFATQRNRQLGAGEFEKMSVTFTGPHPGNPDTIGGRTIRISTVQNRGGFLEVLTWSQWITAAVRTSGIYLATQNNPQGDEHAQSVWERFTRSIQFSGSKVTGYCR